jgi:predicted flavoprotein YhiN
MMKSHPDCAAWQTPAGFARAVKSLPIHLSRPRPIAEAISSAGGASWSEVDENLMLRKCPGIFLAGEMLDWEAPTGGYLIQGCFSTGTRAGLAAAKFSCA